MFFSSQWQRRMFTFVSEKPKALVKSQHTDCSDRCANKATLILKYNVIFKAIVNNALVFSLIPLFECVYCVQQMSTCLIDASYCHSVWLSQNVCFHVLHDYIGYGHQLVTSLSFVLIFLQCAA